MTTLEFLNIALGISTGIIGWFAKELWTIVKLLKDDLVKLQNDILLNYVRKDDFREFKTDLFAALQRIESKLDAKQDK